MVAAIHLLPSGETHVRDHEGNRQPQLEKSWLLHFAEHLMSKGVDIVASTWEIPGGTAEIKAGLRGLEFKLIMS